MKLTQYYRAAIVQNIPDVNKMKTAVLTTLYHYTSTDEKHDHSRCPASDESWCFYNKAVARRETPRPHKEMIHTPINSLTLSKIIPVYQRLACNAILERCTWGKTQNANESLHSVIWAKCPKQKFVSKKKIELAVIETVALFNKGSLQSEVCRTPQGSRISTIRKRICEVRDKRRMKQSVKRCLQEEKLKRQVHRVTKLQQEDQLLKKEGKTYGSGEF